MKRDLGVSTILSLCTILAVVPSTVAQSEANLDPRCRTSYMWVNTESGNLNVRESPNDGRIIGRVPRGLENGETLNCSKLP